MGAVRSRYNHVASSQLTARPGLSSAASQLHFSPGSAEETPQHKMLLLPAAALCCLCSALVTMAAEMLIQDQLSLTRRVDESVSFSCGRTDRCDYNYIFWYQKKEKETFRVILRIDRNEPVVKLVVKPVVSVYPAAARAHLEGKSSLLCVASAMFPPLVQFSWERQKEGGPLELVSADDGEQLVLTESGRSAAILLIDQPQDVTYKYRCSVKHESGTVEAQTRQGDEGLRFQLQQLPVLQREHRHAWQLCTKLTCFPWILSSLSAGVWASTVPDSCFTEQRYVYVASSGWSINKMAAERPDSVSTSCSSLAGENSFRGISTFCFFQENWTRGGDMAEATHSRELFPSRWALAAAGYTLTTGFTTGSSEAARIISHCGGSLFKQEQ
ncbi:hypothetical protein INR49_008165 [Caranx melampygus]|nr:hypothetical protein INR49_008165 [Caranx melampygus]